MIVQRTQGGLRFITQRDHALLAGTLARAWDVDLSPRCLETIDRHDDPWIEEDQAPTADGQGGYHDFVTLDLATRLDLYTRGLDALGPTYVALLTSLHYERLMGRSATERWKAAESARRAQLTEALFVDPDELEHDLSWLRFFDALSLYACMTAPDLDATNRPAWLNPDYWARDPAGRVLSPSWAGPEELVLEGAPIDAVGAAIPYMDAAGRPQARLRLRITPG